MIDYGMLVLQAVGLVFLLLFARGVYIIWTATEPVNEQVRRELRRQERGEQSVEVPNEYEREIHTEARGRLALYKRQLKSWWPL